MRTSPIPLSSLGVLTGRFYLDESWPLISMRCYFDGSEIFGEQDRWITLASIIASDVIWARFQGEWELMLKDRYPVAPFLHMTDLVSGNDPFERIVGWTEEKKKQLVYDSSEVLRKFNAHDLCVTYCSLNLSARERILAEGIFLPSPEVVCAELCLIKAVEWYTKRHGVEAVFLHFDQGERFRKTLYGRWKNHDQKTIKPPNIWGLIGGMPEADMRYTPPIQAADLVAWSISRMHSNTPDVWSGIAKELVWTRDQSTGEARKGMLTTEGLIANEGVVRRLALRLQDDRPNYE